MQEPRLGMSKGLKITLIVCGVILAALVAGVIALDAHFSPLLKKQAIAMLSNRFHSEVEIQDFHASLFELQISGGGLVIRHHGRTDVPPMIAIDKFFADADLSDILGKRWHIKKVTVKGLSIHIPPRELREHDPPNPPSGHDIQAGVEELISDDAELVLIPGRPDRIAHVFDIHHLVMRQLGLGRAASYEATLTNPTPPGDIHAKGNFGPWEADEPSTTPVHGDYTFQNADLSVFNGISGILSSTGKFGGPLDDLAAEGDTQTPDFAVSLAGHKVNLTTHYQATIDGSNGDTLLHPVIAKFLQSTLVAEGGVVKAETGKGRVIKLNVSTDKARLEDLLMLAVKGSTPPMTGIVSLKTAFLLPPGKADLSDRLGLDGHFNMQQGRFTDDTVAAKIRELSRRGQGKPGDEDVGSDVSALSGHFVLKNGVITFRDLRFRVRGAEVELAGTFTLDNQEFDMKGHLRLQAKLSQTVKGMKSLLLKPVDPFFRKDGKTQIPIKISGTRDHLSFGLAL